METTDIKTPEQITEEETRKKAYEEERKNRPYKLYAGGFYRHEVAPYDGQHFEEECSGMSGFEVYTKDIESIKSACALLGLKFYKIEDDRTTIYESEPVIAQETRRKAEYEATAAAMQAKADAFNALPEVIKQWNLPEGAIVQLKKTSAAEYKREWSNTNMASGGTDIILSIPGTMKASSIYPSSWITNDGKIQKKKLRESFSSWPAAVVEALIDGGLKEYVNAKDGIRNKYRVN